jgi:hypothetical protein
MPLTDTGITEIQDAFLELQEELDSFIAELDRVINSEEVEDDEALDDILDLMQDSIEEFQDEIDEIFEDEFTSSTEADLIDDIDEDEDFD